MIGPPHSQLVPTSPIWSQLAPRSLAFSCQGVGVYRIQEICNCCCPHSKIMMWCWPWCVPIQEPKTANMHHVFCKIHGNCQCWLMVCASHNPAGQGKNHGPAPTVFPAWETENVQNLLGFVIFWWNALCATKLEAQPSPIQMLRPHATSRQWFMQISWQAQWKLMDVSLVNLH